MRYTHGHIVPLQRGDTNASSWVGADRPRPALGVDGVPRISVTTSS